ncbi:hypothetical protein PC116_g6875 [Phytophthora cactorum]|uniref:Uncharacterized protein n=1 Tax=Phytophthora cactorum TaxID=29920 RepID=A0A8T1EDI8_9STRA|nr:hypothetical protein Pcac1_g10074 [Phytophthora cactorum]KAG2922848.1 hypothetical protein PC114_g5050 [Phytophthora cactorum]KAG2949811.1 hypothetical protein PC117_g4936 [Phytophthora cactorum]KAG2988745.1 hypothetical protein PC120_g23315 [Phytophthora cactorum]KAG3015238.1 hypothetical protein PC119_g11854 [Phytophthora cactorum]
MVTGDFWVAGPVAPAHAHHEHAVPWMVHGKIEASGHEKVADAEQRSLNR